jgi:hypothetical protein
MSFTIYTHEGMKVIQWFFNIDKLIKDKYHRN